MDSTSIFSRSLLLRLILLVFSKQFAGSLQSKLGFRIEEFEVFFNFWIELTAEFGLWVWGSNDYKEELENGNAEFEAVPSE